MIAYTFFYFMIIIYIFKHYKKAMHLRSVSALPLIRGVTLVFTLLAASGQLSRDYHTLIR